MLPYQACRAEVQASKSQFADLLEYFCEDPSLNVGEFFTVFHDFFAAFASAKAKVDRQAAMEKRKAGQQAGRRDGVSDDGKAKPNFVIKKKKPAGTTVFA